MKLVVFCNTHGREDVGIGSRVQFAMQSQRHGIHVYHGHQDNEIMTEIVSSAHCPHQISTKISPIRNSFWGQIEVDKPDWMNQLLTNQQNTWFIIRSSVHQFLSLSIKMVVHSYCFERRYSMDEPHVEWISEWLRSWCPVTRNELVGNQSITGFMVCWDWTWMIFLLVPMTKEGMKRWRLKARIESCRLRRGSMCSTKEVWDSSCESCLQQFSLFLSRPHGSSFLISCYGWGWMRFIFVITLYPVTEWSRNKSNNWSIIFNGQFGLIMKRRKHKQKRLRWMRL
jgi:hypothetical protein